MWWHLVFNKKYWNCYPFSCCFLHTHIRPSSAIFSCLILCPSILLKTPLHSVFLLLHTPSFIPSPLFVLWISLVLEDMMSSEVFMFVLWVQVYKQMSWGNAVYGYSRTWARKLLCLRCKIIYKNKSLQKLPGRVDFGLQGWTLWFRVKRTYSAFTSSHRII